MCTFAVALKPFWNWLIFQERMNADRRPRKKTSMEIWKSLLPFLQKSNLLQNLMYENDFLFASYTMIRSKLLSLLISLDYGQLLINFNDF